MRNYLFWPTDQATIQNQKVNPAAIRNQEETFKAIDSIGGLHGNVLDIGTRNHMTELLEQRYNVKIYSTHGDLDEMFSAPLDCDFIHYNNVIEHQFNPLKTLIEIKIRMKPNGIIILGCPLKPTWITFNKCHFHEFDKYRYEAILKRAGFREIYRKHFYRKYSIKGVRPFLASFQKRKVISLLVKDGISQEQTAQREAGYSC